MILLALFIMGFFHLFGYGPMWGPGVAPIQENCAKNFWLDSLFINNVHNIEQSCLGVTWYLACDM